MTERERPAGGPTSDDATSLGTVTVPRTPAGVAAAVTHAAAAHDTTGVGRSLRANRSRPPAVEFGDRLAVPTAVAAETPETGIELRLPASLRSVFVGAPLAFYLGADVSVVDDATPRLLASATGVDRELGDLTSDVPDLLARAFWLDCLIREASTGAELAEGDALDALGLDPDRLVAQSPADRLAAYLDAPFERVADRLPEWHLAMHVAPTYDHATALPYLLDRLAFVFPPETASLDRQELVSRSLDDFYRGAPGPVASVEMLDPVDRPGRTQGWLADGTPVDAFKTQPVAYRNHDRYRAADRDGMSVAVVLNDRGMAGEHDAVADIYETRASDLPMDVSFHERLTRRELADLLADHHEFVHYIGHCEVEGLRCADGHLAASDLGETNVETFFLNACGSYHEGTALVEAGSVAGAVTLRKVLDEQAAKVGTAFARLLLAGFPIVAALRLARRRIRMGKDYAVVGDGTQTLAATDDRDARVAHVERLDDDRYRVAWEHQSLTRHGDGFTTPTPGDGRRRLCGNPSTTTTDGTSLASALADADAPVVLDGRFHWADEAAAVVDPSRHP
ncbi:CHAT domain-containing protein [Halobacterium jilantaiense]|uniref:CHAT domain-containing protein n=1 Tax=Halobacterium jilantaiense TaxID=355548 RepID=A0A1I0QRP6_9EURY|nr:CHAT domain-containing protein [Halobacterium jilantaiense]SEW30049.1 CHAT domain-containing protein [Halobacterium jilantaiense]